MILKVFSLWAFLCIYTYTCDIVDAVIMLESSTVVTHLINLKVCVR